MSFLVRFWGVRGSIACPSPNHVAFGGNTSCVEVTLGDQHLILDAGTGIRDLGHAFLERGVTQATLLLSHTHWDHINGFPFFAPAFREDSSFHVMAGHLYDRGGIRGILASQMANPMFPVPLDAMKSRLTFEDFRAGEAFALPGGIDVRTAPLNHPDGATGFRIEYAGKSLAYVTDTEHVPGHPDEAVLDLIRGADLVIYDSTYTDAEFPARVGWGHSTWQEGLRLCKAAGARSLAIFHHDPDHDDLFMEEIEALAHQAWDGTLVAREHMLIALS